MRERLVFYLSKMINEQIGNGDKYESIKRSIIIAITDYRLIHESNDYHNVYTLRDKNGKEFTKLVKINTLELPKLPQDDDKSDLWNWMKFLKSENEEEFKMVETKSNELKKAVCILRELSQDEKTKLLFESEEKARMDYEDRMDGAFNNGKIQGEIETEIESVLKLISYMDLSVREAMKILELDDKHYDDVIEQLQKRNMKYK